MHMYTVWHHQSAPCMVVDLPNSTRHTEQYHATILGRGWLPVCHGTSHVLQDTLGAAAICYARHIGVADLARMLLARTLPRSLRVNLPNDWQNGKLPGPCLELRQRQGR